MNVDEFLAKNPHVMVAWPSIRKQIESFFGEGSTIETGVRDGKLSISIFTNIWPLERLAGIYVEFDEWLRAAHRSIYSLIEFQTFYRVKVMKKKSETIEETLQPVLEAKTSKELVEGLEEILDKVDDLEVN